MSRAVIISGVNTFVSHLLVISLENSWIGRHVSNFLCYLGVQAKVVALFNIDKQNSFVVGYPHPAIFQQILVVSLT